MLSDLLCLRRLSGRALPSEGRGRGFESHRGHRAVVQANGTVGEGATSSQCLMPRLRPSRRGLHSYPVSSFRSLERRAPKPGDEV